MHGSNLVQIPFHFEVCGEIAEPVVHSDGETAGNSEEAGKLPTSDERVRYSFKTSRGIGDGNLGAGYGRARIVENSASH
jgi:hypothetical protein